MTSVTHRIRETYWTNTITFEIQEVGWVILYPIHSHHSGYEIHVSSSSTKTTVTIRCRCNYNPNRLRVIVMFPRRWDFLQLADHHRPASHRGLRGRTSILSPEAPQPFTYVLEVSETWDCRLWRLLEMVQGPWRWVGDLRKLIPVRKSCQNDDAIKIL